MNRIARIITKGNNAFGYVSGVIIIILMVFSVADVTGRYALASPILGADLVSEIMLIYAVFLALAAALNARAHVRVTLFTDRLQHRSRIILDLLANTLGAFFFVFLMYGGWMQFWDDLVAGEIMMGPVNIPSPIIQFGLPLGAFLITIQFLLNIAHNIGQLREGQ